MIAVVAGLVIRDGRLLVCGQDKPFYGGFRWEFPGGKIEAGETPEQALIRELREELGIETRIGRVYDVARHTYDQARDVLLLFYPAAIASGEPRPLDGQDIRWAQPGELPGMAFAEADAAVVHRIIAEGIAIRPMECR